MSFRLGGTDGVSVEATKWSASLRRLGWTVRTLAGEGEADRLVPGLGMTPTGTVSAAELAEILAAEFAAVDLVVVENVCSLPLNPVAARAVSQSLSGRPAILHHHDLAWQRPRFAGEGYVPPDDPHWRHVTINDLSRAELEERGIPAVTVRNAFAIDAPAGDRAATRAALELKPDALLLVQPTRAIARKNIPGAVALAEALGAIYWLVGPAEEGYDEELAAIVASSSVPVIHGPGGTAARDEVAHAYAAADVIVLPSSWEGFGNPVVESAIHRRPLAIGRYPVAEELARYGFRWLAADDPVGVRNWLDRPPAGWLEHNHRVAERWFSLARLDEALGTLLRDVMAGPRS